MALRGIRGAITVAANTKEEILAATRELLEQLIRENSLQTDEIASALFSTTEGLNAEFPAVAARELGWTEVPLLCMREIDVPGSLRNCIRVLIHVNTEKKQTAMKHVYLRQAKSLRRPTG
ncbi:MAG: chorismate mutase [Candidatus Margulisbacteria bacterium]|nr:chorismate mutase [Candidatus Margulisiibacteriota bacterium]